MTTFTRMESFTHGRAPGAHGYDKGRAVYARKQIRRPGRWAPARAAPRYMHGHDK